MAQQQIFQPVRGTEKAINNIIPRDNYIYFAYDTGNIYIDKAGARYPMGKSNGIIYADGTDENIVNIVTLDGEGTKDYEIFYSALEDSDVTVRIDNLILNSDGRFFRVKEIQNDKFIATLLSISSTGGGGGTGPIISYTDKAKLKKIDPDSNYLINGKAASINIYALSGRDSDGSILDEKLTIYWTLSEKTETGILS